MRKTGTRLVSDRRHQGHTYPPRHPSLTNAMTGVKRSTFLDFTIVKGVRSRLDTYIIKHYMDCFLPKVRFKSSHDKCNLVMDAQPY
ncbi:hypothetical protein [Phormidium nigroviride]